MSYQRQVLADRERQKAEARRSRVNRAAMLQAEEERTPPRSLFDLPVKRETDDDVAARAKSLLGCYDTVKSSIQTQARDLIGVRSGPQTPGLQKLQTPLFSPPPKTSQSNKSSTTSHRQRSSSSEKRRSRSHSNDDNTRLSNTSHSNSSHSNQSIAKPPHPEATSNSKRDGFGNKDHGVKNSHSNGTSVTKETSRLSNKPSLPHLKIKNETKSAWPSDTHPPVENILQEMKSIDQPLTAIHTPRKDDSKFPFHRDDVTKTHKQTTERPNIFSSIGSKPSTKSKRLEDSDSDSDADVPQTKSPAPTPSGPIMSSNRVPVVEEAAVVESAMLSAESSSDSSSSSSGSDSDSSSDDDDDAPRPTTPKPKEEDSNKMSWSIDSLMQNMKKTSPASILETSASENPASNNSRREDFNDFNINDSWKPEPPPSPPPQDLAPLARMKTDQQYAPTSPDLPELGPLSPDLPPLLSPLDFEMTQNVSKVVDPRLSSSDMDISDTDEGKKRAERPVRRRRSGSSSRNSKKTHSTEALVETTPERTIETTPERTIETTSERAIETTPKRTIETTPKRTTETTPKRTIETTPRKVIETTPRKMIETTPRKTMETTPKKTKETTPKKTPEMTPKRTIRTKAEMKIRARMTSESSDEDIDIEATTPVKQRKNTTQASRLKLLTNNQTDKRQRHESDQSTKGDSDVEIELKDVKPKDLLRNIKYVDKRPSLMVHLSLDLIHRVPRRKMELECRSPEVKEMERPLSEKSETKAIDTSSSSESDDEKSAEVPTAVSPVKTPSQVSVAQLPKIPKRKHPESPEGGAAKRYRSTEGERGGDPAAGTPSPDRSHSSYGKLSRPRATPQWLQDTTSQGPSTSVQADDRTPFSNIVRDWDTPSQTQDSFSGSSFRAAAEHWGAAATAPAPDIQLDPFRADDNSQQPANHYLEEAKKLKHHADKLNDILTKSLTYLESALCFIQCGNAMEEEQAQVTNPSLTAVQKMYKDTLALIRRILRGRPFESGDKEGKLHVLSNRIQALLHLKLFKLGKKEAVKLKLIIDDYSKTQPKPTTIGTQAPSPYGSQGWPRSTGTPSPISPSPSPASVGSVSSQCSDVAVNRLTSGHYSTSCQTGSTPTTSTGAGNSTASNNANSNSSGSTIAIPQRIHSVTQQYINTVNNLYLCHDLWDQADVQAHLHKDFFRELDHHCGELTLHSTILNLVKYVRLGLHRLKDT